MAANIESGTVQIRIRKATIEKISKIIKKNPVFNTPAGVIDSAIDILHEKGIGK